MTAVAFTYDLSTSTGQVRFYAGDVDGTALNKTGGDRTRTDAEIVFLLAQNGNDARLAAAALLEGRAAEYAQSAILSTQGQLRQDFTQRSRQCLEAAGALRAQGSKPSALDAREKVFTMGAEGSMETW